MFDKVVLNKYGYYEIKDKPNEIELEQYYSNLYFQESKSNYAKSYSEAEIKYFYNKVEQKYKVAQKFLNNQQGKLSFLDVGCGEGWALNFFKRKSWNVKGLDYSSYGCEMMNPNCLSDIIIGDINTNVDYLIRDEMKYDIILLDNLLEHVLNPVELLDKLRRLASNSTILIIDVPNDFSVVQNKLLDLEKINEPFWIAIPDHISYFNKNGLSNLCNSLGWETEFFLSDYPIDLNLLNAETNYVNNKKMGKSIHKKRVEIENFLHETSVENTIHLYNILAEMGIGRSITGFFRLKNRVSNFK